MPGGYELVQGAGAAVAFAAMFLVARYRFSRTGRRRGPADIGLD